MRSVICVHERFDAKWPFAADYWHECWRRQGDCELYRTEESEARAPQLVPDPASVQRLALLGFPATAEDLDRFIALEECFYPRDGLEHLEQWSSDPATNGIEAAIARGDPSGLRAQPAAWLGSSEALWRCP